MVFLSKIVDVAFGAKCLNLTEKKHTHPELIL